MKKQRSAQRPVNLDLRTIKQPLPAVISILHRISGLALFFVIPFMLCVLAKSLASAEKFQALAHATDNIGIKFILWLALAALIYHLVAGIRHLLMDIGIGGSLAGGRLGAKLVLVIAVILILLTGIRIW